MFINKPITRYISLIVLTFYLIGCSSVSYVSQGELGELAETLKADKEFRSILVQFNDNRKITFRKFDDQMVHTRRDRKTVIFYTKYEEGNEDDMYGIGEYVLVENNGEDEYQDKYSARMSLGLRPQVKTKMVTYGGGDAYYYTLDDVREISVYYNGPPDFSGCLTILLGGAIGGGLIAASIELGLFEPKHEDHDSLYDPRYWGFILGASLAIAGFYEGFKNMGVPTSYSKTYILENGQSQESNELH